MASSFKRLRDFIQNQMRMSHVYQPAMIRELLKGGGKAAVLNAYFSIFRTFFPLVNHLKWDMLSTEPFAA
jgi:hypothetical protein